MRNAEQSDSKKSKPKLRVVGAAPAVPAPAPSEQEYFRSLHHALDLIFEEAANTYQWTWEQLASHANVCYLTVYNLGERQTRYPRYHTVYKLAKAVGWKLIVQAEKVEKKSAKSEPKVAVG